MPRQICYNFSMGSIYVSICCLGIDHELHKTIQSCINNADTPENVHIGVAMTGNYKFYDFVVDQSKNFKNVNIKYYALEENFGVGSGRNNAASLYTGQDYFLQIDAHTHFTKGWDSYLVDRLTKAQEITNNKKTILSGYPGLYVYAEGSNTEILIDKYMGYPQWIPNKYRILDRSIPSWDHSTLNNVSSELENIVDISGFAPISKISAAFIFGDYNFANNPCLDKDATFWEEELIQTTELLCNGFTLVYPGKYSPIHHLYTSNRLEGVGAREGFPEYMARLGIKYDDYLLTMETRFLEYISSNPEKVEIFENYNKISLQRGAERDDLYPTVYSNLK